MCTTKKHEWSQWLPLAEYWYNTSYHTTIKTIPFEILYGQPPLTHLPYLHGECSVEAVDRSLQVRVLQMLK